MIRHSLLHILWTRFLTPFHNSMMQMVTPSCLQLARVPVLCSAARNDLHRQMRGSRSVQQAARR